MRIIKKQLDTINVLMIYGFDIDNDDSANKLVTIIKKLTTGNEFYFEFFKENFFLDEEELILFRNSVPEYIKQNGVYIIDKMRGNEHLGSLGLLNITEGTYNQIINMWKYFEGILFFNPINKNSWNEYLHTYKDIKPEGYGEGIIQKKLANSLFIKGHDGDNLIFSYGSDFDKKLIDEIVENL